MNVPPFSYSTLKAFETCARQYHEIKVLKKYPSPKTEQILYGERLHEAAEHYVASGVALTTEFEFMKPMLDNLLSLPGAKFAERKMAVTRDLVPCDWKAPDVWYKGIADFSAVDLEGKRGFVCDYKSGSNRFPDTDQLELMSLLKARWSARPCAAPRPSSCGIATGSVTSYVNAPTPTACLILNKVVCAESGVL
jgi:hypothetical protein